MAEQFNVAETFDDYTTLEKALEETVLIAAGKEAKRRAAQVNAANDDILYSDSIVDENTKELDIVVKYLLDEAVYVSGNVRDSTEALDAPVSYVDRISAKFQGFVVSRDDFQVSYDYVFSGVVNDEGQYLSDQQIRDEIERGARCERRFFRAKTDQVFMEFGAMHPMRALAILQTSYPQILEQIDEIVIGPEGRSELEKLTRLAELSIPMAGLEADTVSTLSNAVEIYIRNVIDLDYDVPYSLVLGGGYLPLDSEKGFVVPEESGRTWLLSASKVAIQPLTYDEDSPGDKAPGNYLRPCLFGHLHGQDQFEESTYAMIPVDHIKELRSLRSTLI